MSHYTESLANRPLRQCEVLCGIVEHRPLIAAADYEDNASLDSRKYPYLVVVTNECDLLYDYLTRAEVTIEAREVSPDWEREHHKILPHVLLCEAFTEAEIKDQRNLKVRELARIEKNQNERYHYIPQSNEPEVPGLYLDFKKHFSIATQAIYDALESGGVTRCAVLDGDRRYDLMHRFYSCLSRIGVEDNTA